MSALMLLAGLVLLVIAGDALVRGAVAAAEKLHIPHLIIGLTIVALGTSAPELVVSLEAALKGAPGLAIGNVVGSNISNLLLVLGLPAIFSPMLLHSDGIRRALVFMLLVSFALFGLMLDGTLSRLDALMLLTALVGYLGYSGWEASKARGGAMASAQIEELNEELNTAGLSINRILLLTGFGIVGLAFGGKMTTDGALGVAAWLGVADTAVGLTIVALGTSLPELAAGTAAALRKQGSVAIGNVLGSNVFNILGILGLTGLVIPLQVPATILDFDIWYMIAAGLPLLPVAFITRKLGRWLGLGMSVFYLVYIVLVFQMGAL